MINVAINGFGRIGRMVFKIAWNDPKINIVAINDLTDNGQLAYLLKYDSMQETFAGKVRATKSSLVVDGKAIKVYAERDPMNLPWKDLKVDVVVESTGMFTHDIDAKKHLDAGAKKVIISAPVKHDEKCKTQFCTIVKGVNDKVYKKQNIVSNASCTTNCLAPVVKTLHDAFKVKQGFMTTTHAYTGDQKLLDGPHKKDPRRGRSAAINIVPTTSGATKAVEMVIPQLKGKLNGLALRVPVATGSIVDFVCEVGKDVTVEKVNAAMQKASQKQLKGVMQYTKDPIVSSDVVGNSHSCVFDSALTQVLNKRFVKVLVWYDNEWGYSNRMIDVIKMISK